MIVTLFTRDHLYPIQSKEGFTVVSLEQRVYLLPQKGTRVTILKQDLQVIMNGRIIEWNTDSDYHIFLKRESGVVSCGKEDIWYYVS